MAPTIETIDHGPVREVRLARPPANAFSPELLAELEAALAAACTEGTRAIVLSGSPGMFSGGLDVPVLLGLDRAGIAAAWHTFLALVHRLAASPVPIAAAITGHATAGGCVLPLYCDHRVMADGKPNKDGRFSEFKIGVNEVLVGLPMPAVILPALERLVGARQMERLATTSVLLPSSEAHRIGLVDEITPLDETVPRAIAWCDAVLALPSRAYLRTREAARRSLVAAVEAARSLDATAFVEDWFHPEAQGALSALVERLAKR